MGRASVLQLELQSGRHAPGAKTMVGRIQTFPFIYIQIGFVGNTVPLHISPSEIVGAVLHRDPQPD